MSKTQELIWKENSDSTVFILNPFCWGVLSGFVGFGCLSLFYWFFVVVVVVGCNVDLKNSRQRNFSIFSFLLILFDTVSLLTERLQREVTFHWVATKVKSASAPKHVLSAHKSVHFSQSVLMWHCQFLYSSLLLPCKLWLDFHYI